MLRRFPCPRCRRCYCWFRAVGSRRRAVCFLFWHGQFIQSYRVKPIKFRLRLGQFIQSHRVKPIELRLRLRELFHIAIELC